MGLSDGPSRLSLSRQCAPSVGEIEEDRLILGVGALPGLLIAFDSTSQAVFGCTWGRLGSHLSHLFKQEHTCLSAADAQSPIPAMPIIYAAAFLASRVARLRVGLSGTIGRTAIGCCHRTAMFFIERPKLGALAKRDQENCRRAGNPHLCAALLIGWG